MECIAVLLVLVLAIAAGSPAACRAEVPCNLVPNGSFEADADRDGIPDGWELSVGPDDRSLVAGLRDGSPTGGRSLCIEKAMAVPGTHLQSSSFALKPHRTYEVRAWLMMEGRFSRDGVQLRVAMDTHRESSELVVNRRWGQSVVRFFTEDETQTGYLQFANLGGLAHRLCIAGVEVCEVEGRVERAPIWVTDLADFEFPEYRPRVAHTAEDLDEIRSSMQGEDIRGHEWVKDAEEWLERPLHLFEEGYAVDGEWREFFMKGLSCARDGARLRPVVHPDGTHEMQCETCDEVYRDEAHRRCARARTNENNARGVGVLGRAYSLTGDTRYAERAAEILVGLARHYKQWGPPPHLAPYPLNEAHALLPIAAGYDDIYSSGALSLEDWRMVERNMLRPAAEFYIDHANTNGRMNNRGAIHNSAVMAIG
ncbi:MAG: hypothetical protein QGI83_21430, partial [Candidatus Latescibacteria bacterium]|nr:hypothetical protein [Candidatus Latescibacterota bacterium]